MMGRVYIKTFGCQMNVYDSERIASVFRNLGYELTNTPENADYAIINTCSVREKPQHKVDSELGRLKKFDNLKIGVCGCVAQQEGMKFLDNYDYVDFVFGTDAISSLFDIYDMVENGQRVCNVNFNEDKLSIPVFNREKTISAFVTIMKGCDNFCSYCIVPYVRGREKSRDSNEIIYEIENLTNQGVKEITLLGQNVNSYRDNGKKCFAKLLRKIDELHSEGLSRLRFTAAHPQDFTDDVIDALAEMKTSCPYIHLPAQHGSNEVLRAMERNYTVEHFEEIIRKIREKIPNATISTDIIVGFPGETEEQFQELLDFGKRVGFDFSFTAIYSPRKHTAAGEMTDKFIPEKIKKERFHRFDEVVKESSWKNREKAIGKTLEVLVEKSVPQEDGLFRHSGRSREFFEVYFTSGRNLVGQEVPVKITSRAGYVLNGELV